MDPFQFEFLLKNAGSTLFDEQSNSYSFNNYSDEEIIDRVSGENSGENKHYDSLHSEKGKEGETGEGTKQEPRVDSDAVSTADNKLEDSKDTQEQLESSRVWGYTTDTPGSKTESGLDNILTKNLEENQLILKLEDFYTEMTQRQDLIETGVYEKSGPGRRRKNPYLRANAIKEILLNYLKKSIKEVLNNKRWNKRKDAMTTIYFRKLKKVTYELVKYCATKNLYKTSDAADYIVSFAESHFALLASINKTSDTSLFESFAEFIIIYFPSDKAKVILSSMMSSKKCNLKLLQTQLNLLDRRDVTTKEHILNWAQNSWTLRQIFNLALEVLRSDEFQNMALTGHLLEITESFLVGN